MYERGFEHCLNNPMTGDLRQLASEMPVKLMPGNHDFELGKYRDNPRLGNPISPIKLIEPFASNRLWYCHGHEYDPAVQLLPRPVLWTWNHLKRRITPGNLRGEKITGKYLMMVFLIHTRAMLKLREMIEQEHKDLKGIVLGHTHFPVFQHSPDMLFLFNDGDMRHSATFTVEDDIGFTHLTWNEAENKWREARFAHPV
jgi:UDP-2,3-diacylglucosamine pyrophosphatase LpxH